MSYLNRIGLDATPPPFKLSRATAAMHRELFGRVAAYNLAFDWPEKDAESIELLTEELAILESVEPVIVAIESDHAPALKAATKKVESAEADARSKLLDAGYDAEAVEQAVARHPRVVEAREALSPIASFHTRGLRRKTADLVARCQSELEALRLRASRPTADRDGVNRSRPLFRRC